MGIVEIAAECSGRRTRNLQFLSVMKFVWNRENVGQRSTTSVTGVLEFREKRTKHCGPKIQNSAGFRQTSFRKSKTDLARIRFLFWFQEFITDSKWVLVNASRNLRNNSIFCYYFQ